jgi:predicted nucleic acid-binding protein
MILTDTGPLVAILNRTDAHHSACVAALKQLRPPMVTTWPVLTEAFYLLEDAGRAAQETLVELVINGRIAVYDVVDHARLLELLRKYADRPMDLAESSLVLLAEQLRLYEVFTLDQADFRTYRAHGRRVFDIIPA